MTNARAVFVFTRDGDLLIFRDKDEAAGSTEAIDVHDGEYEALYSIDGAVRPLTPIRHTVASANLARAPV